MPADTGNFAPDVYFPIEITTREYAGHILLAARLASRGMNAIIGHKTPVQGLTHAAKEPGIVFYKGAVEGGCRTDFGYVGQDPETGLSYQDYSNFAARRYALSHLNTSQAYFCFGQDDYDYLSARNPHLAERIHPSGSPRTMLWGSHGAQFHAARTEEIWTRYGPFVLVVSSGSRGSPVIAKQLRRSSRGEQETIRKQMALARAHTSLLVERARAIRKGTGLNVVIRPHPVESWAEWRRDVENDEGLFVDSAYELGSWIRAAEFVIQSTKSTAAFETWLADTPNIADAPPTPVLRGDGSSVDFVTHELCIPFPGNRDMGDIDLIRQNWSDLKAAGRPRKLLARKLYSPPKDATLHIADVIESLVDKARPSQVRRTAIAALRYGLMRPAGLLRRDREMLGRLKPPPFKRWTLRSHDVARDLESACSILGIDDDVHSYEIFPNTFVVTSSSVQ